MAQKTHPIDQPTQFICDSCGRTYNKTLLESSGGQELCANCYGALGHPLTTPAARLIIAKKKAAEKANLELKEAIEAEQAEKDKVIADEKAAKEKALLLQKKSALIKRNLYWESKSKGLAKTA